MAKWRRKPVIVDAEVYSPGMEDGFDNNCNWSCANIPEVCKECGCHNKPFIRTSTGVKRFISLGDFIVTGEKAKDVYRPVLFLSRFERVCDHE